MDAVLVLSADLGPLHRVSFRHAIRMLVRQVARDGGRCGYCDARATTVDHITPRARGGRNTWKNTVGACGPCNQRKGDRTPAEAGMVLRVKPTAPSWASLASR